MTANRTKCLSPNCPAMASPSGTGYCSYHDSQRTPVGQRPTRAAKQTVVSTGHLRTPPPPSLQFLYLWQMPVGTA
jgi:hypothetical protein